MAKVLLHYGAGLTYRTEKELCVRIKSRPACYRPTRRFSTTNITNQTSLVTCGACKRALELAEEFRIEQETRKKVVELQLKQLVANTPRARTENDVDLVGGAKNPLDSYPQQLEVYMQQRIAQRNKEGWSLLTIVPSPGVVGFFLFWQRTTMV